jgi:surface polysaccharide O-acyltransferase-like enzyme
VIAGAATWYALGVRTPVQYVRERFLRLLIPFLFALATLIPLMLNLRYLGRAAAPTVGEMYQRFWTFNLNDLSGYRGTFTPAHLWFIVYLFVFSLVALPLFLYLKRHSDTGRVSRLLAPLRGPGVVILPVILLALLSRLPGLGDKNPFYYCGLFILGFVVMGDRTVQETIKRWTIGMLVAAVAGTLLYYAFRWEYYRSVVTYSPGWYGYGLLQHFCQWMWVVALLGVGQHFLNANSRLLHYTSEAAYPFYIWHLPVNTLVAYFVIQLPASIGVKYVVINLLTVGLTLVIYEVVVKRFGLARLLFGMKPKQKLSGEAVRPLKTKPA